MQPQSIHAQKKSIDFSPNARKAYQLIMQLRFKEAEQKIQNIRTSEPNNYVTYFLENYIDFFSAFIGETDADFDKMKANKNMRLSMIDKTDPSSPYFLYCKAEMQLQWALARLKFEEYTRAFFEIKAAYKDLNSNTKKFPNFILNKKSMGVLHAAIGTIPDEYRWGVSWLGGMDGTIDQGIRELESVIRYDRPFLFRDEAIVMYAFVQLHLNNDAENAWKVVSQAGLDTDNSPLACFALSNIAMRSGRNDVAINILMKRPGGSNYFPFHYLNFMLGMAKLHRLDPDADLYLKSYLRQFKGRNYIKEAYQKLAWSQLVEGNVAGYLMNNANIIKYGRAIVDEDKAALREANAGQMPNIDLLKARLLYDGNYYQRSYQLLNSKKESDFNSVQERLEYNYRMGRVLHSLSNEAAALNYYMITLEKGKKYPNYYACNAALNIGLIYEEKNNKAQARKYYNLCLSLSPSEYKSSLHQKAKAGLNRL